jgi:hypothetical protein
MSYGLPVIGTSLYSVPEAIQHMINYSIELSALKTMMGQIIKK